MVLTVLPHFPTGVQGLKLTMKSNYHGTGRFSAGNTFSSLTGHASFQILILVGHLINLIGH